MGRYILNQEFVFDPRETLTHFINVRKPIRFIRENSCSCLEIDILNRFPFETFMNALRIFAMADDYEYICILTMECMDVKSPT